MFYSSNANRYKAKKISKQFPAPLFARSVVDSAKSFPGLDPITATQEEFNISREEVITALVTVHKKYQSTLLIIEHEFNNVICWCEV